MKLFIVAPKATSTKIHLQKIGIWKESQILPMGLGGDHDEQLSDQNDHDERLSDQNIFEQISYS